MKTKEELKQLAVDVLTNKIFIANSEEAVYDAFGVFLAFAGPSVFENVKPFAVYEYYDKAGPLSINGYPSFLSMQILTEEEAEVFLPIFEEKRKALHGEDK